VTYFDAATAWRGIRRHAATAIVLLTGIGLAGCETGASILGGSTQSATQETVATAAPAAPLAKIALAPVIGAPDPVSKQLVSQLTSAVEKQRIVVAPDRDAKADYMLRGYIVAARDKSSTKVSYIWDVTDPTGKRVNRVTGEEVVPSTNPKDPWASVNAEVTQKIADRTASSLGSWLPTQKGAAVASGSGGGATPAAVGGPPSQVSTQSTSSSSATTTASIPRSAEVAAAVPSVTGAPGDGNAALAQALQGELSRQGVTMADRPGSYKVEGKVTMSQAPEGKQSIQIDWRVKDPAGKSLGTVSQKNEIPQGSLDGTWGKTADAAAAAAAQGILKLLPQPKSIN
jgi:uncharacterized lipoprotein YmbA